MVIRRREAILDDEAIVNYVKKRPTSLLLNLQAPQVNIAQPYRTLCTSCLLTYSVKMKASRIFTLLGGLAAASDIALNLFLKPRVYATCSRSQSLMEKRTALVLVSRALG